MEITVKLVGILRGKAAQGGKLELADGATLADVLAALNIPSERVMAVSLNNQFERDFMRVLEPGDVVIVLPPVAGG